jgi:hypothetical protein
MIDRFRQMSKFFLESAFIRRRVFRNRFDFLILIIALKRAGGYCGKIELMQMNASGNDERNIPINPVEY